MKIFIRKRQVVFIICFVAAFSNFAADKPVTLKQAFHKDFLMGVAVNSPQIAGQDTAAIAIVKKQFNSITPENVLKWQPIHPKPDSFNFKPADEFVAFGEANGMFNIGHVLVWHSQTPRWVFQDSAGNPTDRETLLQRMKDHISAVAGRYKGRIKGWDVVNEAFEDDGSYRNSPWFKIIGEDFIEKAFIYAHEADPQAELYYNDFNEWKPGKVQAIIKMSAGLKAKGIRIDAIGMQGHWGYDYPTLKEADAAIQAFADAGLKVVVTELDIDILPNLFANTSADVSQRFEQRKNADLYPNGLPDSLQNVLTRRYTEIFKLFHKHADTIDRVTLWGVDDGHSWKNYFPARRTNYPLLFDRQYQPKPAFDAIIRIAGE
jgi:endo-1,4-beta-xylanase